MDRCSSPSVDALTPTLFMPDSTPSIPALIEHLSAPDAEARASAAEALCRAGESAASAATALVAACGDEDDRVREWAAAALEDLGPPPGEQIAELTMLAAAKHPLVAYWAVTLLGRGGEGAALAVPALEACLAPGTAIEVRQRACWALGKVGPAAASARAALTAAASDADPRLSRLAGEALAALPD
jgi:HEAT repeat protein